MTSFADARVSLITGIIVLLALFAAPLAGRTARRVTFAVVFLVAGEVVVLVSHSADWLRAGLILLQAAVLLLAELAAGDHRPAKVLVGLLWIGCAAVSIGYWAGLGGWVGEHRPWVLLGAVAGAIGCGWIVLHRHIGPSPTRGW